MGDLSRVLQPGQSQSIAMTGTTIYIKTADVPFRIVLDGSEMYGVQQGDKIRVGRGFSEFRIEDTGGAGVNMTLVITDGDYSQSVIASAVRVINDGATPLPVNIAGKSLPDRPYLRNSQTWALQIQSNPPYDPANYSTQRVGLYNPFGSGVSIVDPIAIVTDGGAFSVSLKKLYLVQGATLDPDTPGISNNLAIESGSKGVVKQMVNGNTVNAQPEVNRTHPMLNFRSSSSSYSVVVKAEHGGLLLPEGTGVYVESGYREQQATNWEVSWQWIEQPIA